ncbi:MAG: DUF885 domain-containing protein [Acidobacteriota bacterium]|nr:DUF885 domain-containing protein [Acidobacteriota bacterium]
MAAAGIGAAAAVHSADRAADSSAALKRAQDSYTAFLERESLMLRTRRGLPIESLPDVSLEKAEKDAAFGRSLSAGLAGVAAADLNHEEVLSLEILRKEARALEETPGHWWLTFPITPYTFQFMGVHPAFAAHPFRDRADADRYEKLLSAYAAFLRSIEAKVRVQAQRGIRIAKPELPLIAGMLEPVARESGSNLLRVAPERLAALPAADRDAFAARAASKIDSEVRAAARSLIEALGGEYAARAPDSVGLAQYPGGKDYYRYLVRRTTTLDVPPEEIHRIGLAAMDQINADLEEQRAKVRFSGTLAEFRQSLKKDPRFYAKTPEEVGERLMAAQNRILPRIPEIFGKQPRAQFGVKRLEPALEASITFGYYQWPTPQESKGFYKYNGTHLDERTMIGAGTLISHELVPGHHFQINLQYENESLPSFRRDSFGYTAFVEGWGEYSSFLAGELGMYDDPYDRCGRLLFDAFLTSRLVVDTGMNLLGWSRERAMAYMRENTIQSETEIATETLRYSSDLPSQALAYKMGMRKFVELREKAKKALGTSFDPRRYHDMILASGTVPMDLAERKVDWFIAEEGARAMEKR